MIIITPKILLLINDLAAPYQVLKMVILAIATSSITMFVNLGFFWHFETITNIRTWIKSHRYWSIL